MYANLKDLLQGVKSAPDFSGVNFTTINDTNAFGDNALHCVCVWGDLNAAKLLVGSGINIDQKGEGGFTPLNVALEFGYTELANYLISSGADTSVIGAEFKYDPAKDRRHMADLNSKIDELKSKIKSDCKGTDGA
ncbi:ankyrin repeat domain-containing protein [Solimonas marina]|uniref:Ankyrin repeat domain-containing protein n=1 Tax=Solimonas marina TaxID=2714601 RepID=A0A969WD41_9GAMM|nr:ankyrin repeat domain-containing protein [Solimonas marina]NKF23191.1 ankyrin repeat domain-containing protein [Solimonas marina]